MDIKSVAIASVWHSSYCCARIFLLDQSLLPSVGAYGVNADLQHWGDQRKLY